MHRWISIVVGLLCLVACSPTLDWREFHSADSVATALFPCRPITQTRKVTLGSTSVRMALHACSAGDVTWALAAADVGDPALVSAALAALIDSAVANLGGVAGARQPFSVPGATPNPGATRLVIEGQLPDGRRVVEHVAVFARATQVVQVTALGAVVGPEAAATFFESVRARP